MINRIIILSLLVVGFLVSNAYCQNTTVVNRLMVKDSLAIGNYWIANIARESELTTAGTNTLANDAALKEYLANSLKVPAMIGIPHADSLLTLDPVTREYKMTAINNSVELDDIIDMLFIHPHAFALRYDKFDYNATDTILVEITSADGRITPLSLTDNSGIKFVFGKPPFSLKMNYRNPFPNDLVNVVLVKDPNNGYDPFEINRYTMPSDTEHIAAEGLTGIYQLNFGSPAWYDNLSRKELIFKNETRNYILSAFWESALPQTEKHFTIQIDNATPNVYIGATPLLTTQTGDKVILMGPKSKYSLRTLIAEIYVDNQLFKTQSFMESFNIPYDATWKTVEIILRDTLDATF
ncbi:hypothetical protein ACE38W_04060 [Chitinophaga sp. Hz27]|uniref:hypothetical protein n=1 Tax=Chitinophaga sp. Hz27 TaxID=3347169 RepID=UPI0035D89B98